MCRISRYLGLVILGFAVLVTVGTSQDAKKEEPKKEKEKKITPQIPQGWKALKLSKEQVTKIHAVDLEYKTKIAELDAKIAELKQKSRIEMTKHLTDDQKATLAKLSGLETGKEKDKKKDPDKK